MAAGQAGQLWNLDVERSVVSWFEAAGAASDAVLGDAARPTASIPHQSCLLRNGGRGQRKDKGGKNVLLGHY